MAVDIIDRSKLSGLIPEPVTREIIQGAVTESAVLRMARRLPNMTSKTQTLNVLDALPTAYFVNGEPTTGASDSKASLKKTTNMAWDKKKIYAEEIAVIVPIPEAVLDDSDYDIWGEVRPRLQEAFGKVIDAAILYGTDKPTSWPCPFCHYRKRCCDRYQRHFQGHHGRGRRDCQSGGERLYPQRRNGGYPDARQAARPCG